MQSLKKRNSGKEQSRFYWEGDKKKMWIELASLTDEEISAIREECTEHHVDFPVHPKTGKMQRVESHQLDERKMIDMIYDNTLIAWGNFDLEGQELECTWENKKLLLEKVDGFALFYAESLSALKESMKKRHGGTSARKNS